MEELRIYADYSQFYLMDLGLCPEIPEQVTGEDLSNRFRSAEGIVVFHTEEPGYVSVAVLPLQEPPAVSSNQGHTVEVSLSLPSGVLAIAGCTEALSSCAKLEVSPGQYRCRALYGKVERGGESFTIMLWPEPPSPPLVGKVAVAARK